MTADRGVSMVRRMTSGPAAGTALAPDWAFVVQLREGTALVATQLQGRIEHVTSGQAGAFESLEQALEFMRQVLSDHAGRPT